VAIIAAEFPAILAAVPPAVPARREMAAWEMAATILTMAWAVAHRWQRFRRVPAIPVKLANNRKAW
jgi:hypothetical protein